MDELKALDFEMAPGECVFFTEATLHSSNVNHSDVPRVAYSLRFTTPDVIFDIEGLKEKGIDYLVRTMLVRGEDAYHYNDSLIAPPP